MPEFVSLQHPTFIAFISSYFEWMEQQGNPYEVLSQSHLYMDIDKTVDSFTDWFKRKFLADMPEAAKSSKEFMVKHIREFYRARGTQKSYQFLFRILFNEDIEFSFPKELILKASDGKWIQDEFIKAVAADDNLLLVDRKVTGQTSTASAIIEQALQIQEGVNTVHEMKVSHTKGDFTPGETVSGTDANGVTRSFTIGAGIKSTTVTNPGSGHTVGDIVTVNGGGAGATNMSVKVKSITGGSVDSAAITNAGTGYRKGDYFTIDNTGVLLPDGRSAAIKVTEVEGMLDGLTLTAGGDGYITPPLVDIADNPSGVVSARGEAFLDDPGVVSIAVDTVGSGYSSATVRIEGGGGNGATATANLTGDTVTSITVTNRGIDYYTTPNIFIEGDGTGATATATIGSVVNSIRLTHVGEGYTSAPTVTLIPTNGGSGATATSSVVGTNGDGRITKIEVENTGRNYTALPTVSTVGVGNADAVITPGTTTIGGVKELLIVKHGFGLTENPTLDLTGIGDGLATATATYGSSLQKSEGRWTNTDGQVSSDMKLQDNDFYQDYSYVIGHTGQTIDFWADSVKHVLHPAGMKMFGEIIIRNTLQMPTEATALADTDYTLIFPLLDESLVPSAQMTVSGGLQDITVRITAFAENDGVQKQLALKNKVLNQLLFFTQGGYSTEKDGSSPLLGANIGAAGSNYSSPTGTVSGGGGSGATVSVTQSGGAIDSITITNPGSGYTSPPTITINDGGAGSGATAYAIIGSDNGTYDIPYLDSYFGGQLFTQLEDFPEKRIKLAPESMIFLEKIV